MDFLFKLIEIANTPMTTPTLYRTFHLVWILVAVVSAVLMCVFLKNVSERGVRLICLAFWLVLVAFEIYKQFKFTHLVVDGVFVFDYNWYQFPFQLCSSPHYILPLVFLLPNGRIRDAAIAFLMTFSVFGGLAVFVFPNDVFCATLGLNVQTMVHHGIQIVSGLFLGARYRERLTARFFFGGAGVFAVLLSMAIVINEVVQKWLFANGDSDVCNMFYVSRYFPTTLPVLSDIYPKVPYPVFVAIYALGFVVVAGIIFLLIKLVAAIAGGIARLCGRNGNEGAGDAA